MKELAHASGKRKTAVARATVKRGQGIVKVNRIPAEFHSPELARLKLMEPLKILGKRANEVDIDINVSGGGIMGQVDASRTAMAKALVEYFEDEELKKEFLQYDRTLLVSDTRRKLPKRPMGRGARKKRQKSYR
jgi:small subunit ribosomal protein S9